LAFRRHFAGLENFAAVFADPLYLSSIEVTAVFSLAVAFLALALGLLFAAMADRIVRGVAFYTTRLLLPYAVAPAIAGVLWLFLFNPSIGIIAAALRHAGVDWPLLVTNTPAMTTIVIGIRQMIGNGDVQTAWHLVMATAILALLPPIAVVLAMQRWFVQGLIEPEK
jgi:ABC-type sugar transport system permease subunit